MAQNQASKNRGIPPLFVCPNFTILLRYVFLLVVVGSSLTQLFAAAPCTVSQNAVNLVKLLGKRHYAPAGNTPENNQKVVRLFFSKLDPLKCIFTEPEIKAFESKNYRLNDSVQNDGCRFLIESLPAFSSHLKSFKNDLNAQRRLRATPKSRDTLFLKDIQFAPFPGTDAARKARIAHLDRWFVLHLVYSEWDKKGSFPAYFEANRERLIQKSALENECSFFNTRQMEPDSLTKRLPDILLSAIAELYDPHTNYFNVLNLADFQKSLSAEESSFGVVLGRGPINKLQIERVVPGSNASMEGKLEEGDEVIAVLVNGKPLQDLKCADEHALNRQLESEMATTLALTVRKKSGEDLDLKLTKSWVEVADNHIGACRLLGPERKIGYLALPSFFTGNEQTNSASSTAHELIDLQKQGIHGLVLDLRNNGGGSIKEAVELIGLFIDVGPVCIINTRKNKPEIIKETIRGTLYNGPLVVLVNGHSASASEIFASAIQDLGRGIISGTRTYGKASIQSIFPFSEAKSNSHFVKATIGMAYRGIGLSHQKIGITPDIWLPGYGSPDPGEAMLPNVLTAVSVEKKTDFPRFIIPDLDSLVVRSRARWQAGFSSEPKSYMPLEPGAFASQILKAERVTTRPELNGDLFSVEFTPDSEKNRKLDAGVARQMENQRDQLLRDGEVGEAFRILSDYIMFEKK